MAEAKKAKKVKTVAKKGKKEKYYSIYDVATTGATFCFIYGERSAGKSYSMLAEARTYEDGTPVGILRRYWATRERPHPDCGAHIRRNEVDANSIATKTLCNMLKYNGEGKNVIEEITGGEFDDIRYYNRCWTLRKFDREKGKWKEDTRPFMYFFDLNGWMHSKGTQLPWIKTIWFEEFIDGNKTYLPDEYTAVQNMISTLKRNSTDVKIFFTGNSLDINCPYFRWFNLHNVKNQKQGTIDIYKKDGTDQFIATEYTTPAQRSQKRDDCLALFADATSKMIATGEWLVEDYPKCNWIVKQADICGRFFILFNGETVQADVVSDNKGAYIYMHEHCAVYDPIDYDYDLIYTEEFSMKYNYRRNFTTPQTDNERVISNLIRLEKVFYDCDKTGDTVDSFIKYRG